MLSIDKIFKSINIENVELDYQKHEFFEDIHYLDYSLYDGKKYIVADLFKQGKEVNGYCLDLTSDNKKFIIALNASFFHFISDIVGQVLSLLTKDPELEIVFDDSLLPPRTLQYINYFTYIDYFIAKLNEHNVKNRIVKLSNYDSCIINNFYTDTMTTEISHAPLVYDFFSQCVKDKNIKPFRKVYLSRKVIETRLNEPFANRIDDHQAIEKLFKDLGFEIVHPEYFLTFEDQINYFNEVKVLVSLTSSGLVNSVFMQPNQTMIEIFTPLKQRMSQGVFDDQLHFFYHITATAKNHNYVSINNLDKKVDTLKDTILRDKNFLRFLTSE